MAHMMRCGCLLTCLLCIACPHACEGVDDLAIVPRPASLTATSGSFALTPQTTLRANPGAAQEAQQLAAWLRQATGYPVPITDQADGAVIALELDGSCADKLGSEGYQLSVTPTRMTLRAATPAGLFYAGITLRQLLPVEAFGNSPPGQPINAWTVPCVEIEDQPRFAWRRNSAGCGPACHAGGVHQEVHRPGGAAQAQHAATAPDR